MLNKRYLINKFKLKVEPLIKISGRGKRFLPEKGFWELIYKNFPHGGDFHFVQVGANDGISFDILYDIVKERSSRGTVIEPLKDFYDKLCENYIQFPAIVKVNKAAHPTLKEVTLYRVDPLRQYELQSWTSGIASLDPCHHKKSATADEYIIEEKVEAAPVMQIIKDAATGYDVDLLQIDVEGFDYEILKMINFDQLKPLVIKYEFSNLSKEDLISSKQLLRRNGYYFYDIGDDMIGVLLDKVKL